VRINYDTAAATAIGDAVPRNATATATFADDDSAPGYANTDAGDSATSTFADADTDCADDFNSAQG